MLQPLPFIAKPAAPVPRGRHRGGTLPEVWPVYSRAQLRASGWSAKTISLAVKSGRIVRARRDVYLEAAADADSVAACQMGGRLTCVSELRRWGVFVLDSTFLHVCNDRQDSRLPDASRPLRRHRSRRRRRPRGVASVDLREAFADAVRCQEPRAAVATLDSGLHLGLIDHADLTEILALLPPRFEVLGRLVDQRAESGAESLMRLLLRRLGCRFDVQVRIDDVGRVDFVVEGRIIVECDSREWHGGWEHRRRDLRRDQAAAALGYLTYRPIAEDIFWHPDRVLAALRGFLTFA